MSVLLIDNPVDTATVVASEEEVGYPATNIQQPERDLRWRSQTGSTSSYLDITFGDEEAREYVALVDVNLTTNGGIQIQAWSDALGGAVEVLDETIAPTLYASGVAQSNYGGGTYGSGNYGASVPASQLDARNITIFKLPSSITAKYWRITFTDVNTTYQECARVYITTAIQFSYEIAKGWQLSRQDRDVVRESIGGQRKVQVRDSRLLISGSFDFLSDAERTSMALRNYEIGEDVPIIFSLYPEATQRGMTTTMYGRLTEASFQNDAADINRFPFRMVEEL